MKQRFKPLAAGLAFYAAWTAATWLMEGRIGTFLRPEAVADRIAYALIVNLLLGVGGAILLLRHAVGSGLVSPQEAGFAPGRRTAVATSAGLTLGLGAYFLQGAPSSDPVVIVNAFAQVLVVSAAEVMVCWAVVGTAVRSLLRAKGSAVSASAAAIASSILFGAYHYAHSAPFNTLAMVALLSVVGLATSAFFFVSRDVAGTVVFHNFLGTFGVVQALAKADALSSFQALKAPLLSTAALTAALLIAGYVVQAKAAERRRSSPGRHEFAPR